MGHESLDLLQQRNGKLNLMKISMGWRLCFALLAITLSNHRAFAAGVVTAATEAELRSALVGGGNITFSVSGKITLTTPLVITNDTVVDGSGQAVILSGGSSVRVFTVDPNAKLTLKQVTIADGLALGTNGTPGVDGGPGRGGAVYLNGGTLSGEACVFTNNVAVGGDGAYISWPFPRNGAGGVGQGGSIFSQGGVVALTNCMFIGNWAKGGMAGVSPLYGDPNSFNYGGTSSGGAICSTQAQVTLANCLVRGNTSFGGRGRRSLTIRESGSAFGGAVQINGGSLALLQSVFEGNSSLVEYGNSVVQGGAVLQTSGTLEINQCYFNGNRIIGGVGLVYGVSWGWPGGNGLGGAICLLGGTAGITNSTFADNVIEGGKQASGNTPGAALGGAVYSTATVNLENCTVAGNAARAGENQGTGLQGGAYGGGLCNQGGTMSLVCVTAAGNAAIPSATNVSLSNAIAQGGALFTTNGTASLRGSILASSLSGSNSFGSLTDLGYNLSSDASGNFSAGGSLNNTDPKLGSLDYYGGPTPTMVLLSGSPAIDGGDMVGFPPADQRGHARPYGAAADIGAFESSPPYVIRGTVWGATLNEEVDVVTSTANTTTINHGRYSLEGLAAGTYSVVPTSTNFLFAPTNRLVTVGPDQLNVDYKAYRWNALSLEGVANGVMHLAFAGTNGQSYRILASSNLVDWLPISTNSPVMSNLFEFSAPIIKTNGNRFYRAVRP
jgi:hypothetical protein